MHESVDRRDGGHGAGKDAFPLAEDQIRGDEHGAALIALGHQREEHFGFVGILLEVADVIHDEQFEVIEFSQQLGRDQIAFGSEQFLHQGRYTGRKSTVCPASTMVWPMAHSAWLLPTPGKPKARMLTARPRKPPPVSSRTRAASGAGRCVQSKPAMVLATGRCAALRRRAIRRSRHASAPGASNSVHHVQSLCVPGLVHPPHKVRCHRGEIESPQHLGDRRGTGCRNPLLNNASYTARSGGGRRSGGIIGRSGCTTAFTVT